MKPVEAYLGLGANRGERRENIERALRMLDDRADVWVEAVAPLMESEPAGAADQAFFLNTAARVRTTCSPWGLLDAAKEVEKRLGREPAGRWEPRPIDVDILFYGDRVMVTPRLVIPHPLACERIFTLRPLAALAPDLVHPVFGRTVGEMFSERRAVLELYRWAECAP